LAFVPQEDLVDTSRRARKLKAHRVVSVLCGLLALGAGLVLAALALALSGIVPVPGADLLERFRPWWLTVAVGEYLAALGGVLCLILTALGVRSLLRGAGRVAPMAAGLEEAEAPVGEPPTVLVTSNPAELKSAIDQVLQHERRWLSAPDAMAVRGEDDMTPVDEADAVPADGAQVDADLTPVATDDETVAVPPDETVAVPPDETAAALDEGGAVLERQVDFVPAETDGQTYSWRNIAGPLVLFTVAAFILGVVLYLELQWYYVQSPYQWLGLLSLGGVLGLTWLTWRAASWVIIRRHARAAARLADETPAMPEPAPITTASGWTVTPAAEADVTAAAAAEPDETLLPDRVAGDAPATPSARQIAVLLGLFALLGAVVGTVLYLEVQWYSLRQTAQFAIGGVLGAGFVGMVAGMLINVLASTFRRGPRGFQVTDGAAGEAIASAMSASATPMGAMAASPLAADSLPADTAGPGRSPVGSTTPPPASSGETPRGPVVSANYGQARTWVGVDIGSRFIKMVQVARTRQGPAIVNFGCIPTPPKAVKDGVIQQPVAVADALNALLAAQKVRQRKVIAAVSGQAAVIRNAEFPKMSASELRETLKWEAEQHIPIPPDDGVIDFAITNDGSSEPPKPMGVMLVGCQKRIVQGYVDTFADAGLKPIALEVDLLAVYRALGFNGYFPSNQQGFGCALLDLGASSAYLSMFHQGLPQQTRNIPVAGNRFAEAIAEGMGGIGEEKARELRNQYGVAIGTPVSRLVQPVAEELLLEIRRSLEFYLVKNVGRVVSHLFLVGGLAKMRGVPEFLESRLNEALKERQSGAGLTVVVASPTAQMTMAPPAAEAVDLPGPEYLEALGLALREEKPDWLG
jgi:type IV pilus assembly protein PilM